MVLQTLIIWEDLKFTKLIFFSFFFFSLIVSYIVSFNEEVCSCPPIIRYCLCYLFIVHSLIENM